MANYKKGDKVSWEWGGNKAEGTIEDIIEHEVTRKIKGSEVTRKGSKENPVLIIKQADGDHVLKLAEELEKRHEDLKDK